ncbi:MAG: DNA-processing protein DprA [Gemmatimonadetes bacterium]|nr:DNA-processing protein DprA [Gemmatimonadota bacterium]
MRRAEVLGPREPRWIGAQDLPECFRELSRPPAGLWCLGDAGSLAGVPDGHVAIVGTREASPYGIRVAERLAAACAKAGLVVVSGLARGVDAAAHRAALAEGGRTIGVQGTGVDVPYPASHRTLHDALVQRGTVISEMEPGTRATPGCFPRRNRLIAALCRVTLVVEAGFKSGAINTASQALDLGRTVAAVPGRIDDPGSSGANLLIRDGAQVITEIADLLALFGPEFALRYGESLRPRSEGVVAGRDQAGGSTGRQPLGPGLKEEEQGPGGSPRELAEGLLRAELDGSLRRVGPGLMAPW